MSNYAWSSASHVDTEWSCHQTACEDSPCVTVDVRLCIKAEAHQDKCLGYQSIHVLTPRAEHKFAPVFIV